ncbi:MAG: hypothetical protein RR475_02305 [Clostridia bacterium]
MDYDELMHYGILGMRWGVRRTPAQLGNRSARKSSGSLKKEKRSRLTKKSKSKTVAKVQKRTVKDMADEELKAKISRLEMEKKYSDLNPSAIEAGKKFAHTIGKAAVQKVAIEVGVYMLRKVAGKISGEDITKAPTIEISEAIKSISDSNSSKKNS